MDGIPHSAFISSHLFFLSPEDSNDFDDEARQNENRGDGEASGVKHFLVEHVGVGRAAANHQDEADGDEGQADEHEEVVHFAEGHDFLVVSLLFCCFLCYFFCHIRFYCLTRDMGLRDAGLYLCLASGVLQSHVKYVRLLIFIILCV